jgi:hypothetical protein
MAMRKISRDFFGVASWALVLFPQFAMCEGIILAEEVWTAGNGNTYVVVQMQGSTWDEAAADVASLIPGYHLATITSQGEQDFLDNFLINAGLTSQYWLGGYQIMSKPETDPAAGWEWITGEPWQYTNWGSIEPNNAGGLEDHLATSPFLGWNDEGSAIGSVFGYIAENEPAVFFPYIGEPVAGIILNTQLAPGSGGSAGVIQTGGLAPGVEAFVDRIGQQWQIIPAQLIGADFIQTAQNNADVPSIEIDVSVATGTILHMFVPEHGDLLPFEWMNKLDFGADWVNTGALIHTSWTGPAQVWSTATPLPAGTYRFRGLPDDLSFYGIAATQVGITVSIDIKPGSDSNPINCKSRGVVPVAVLGSMDFDATQVDFSTVRFGPKEAPPVHDGHVEDANSDGFVDSVFHFESQYAGFALRDTTATLIGETYEGQPFSGADTISTLHCGKLIASFADDMRGGGLPHGSNTSAGVWVYGWNSVGAIGDPTGTFSWLLATTDVAFLYDTDGSAGLPDDPPGSFTYMGFVDTAQTTAGGHPGQGYDQNAFERFVMAVFVLPEDGYFEIQNSLVQLVNPNGNVGNSDGLSYFVAVGADQPSAVGFVDPGYLNSGSFDTSLGYHSSGDLVVVGIGSRGNDNFDSFSLEFDIVAVPKR